MGAIATFDRDLFIARYPEFASVPTPTLQSYFAEATLYLANDGTGPVDDPVQQLVLLNMLVAHLTQMNSTVGGQAPSSLVGPITSASEGSVSVSTNMGSLPGSAAWFSNTRYGFEFWRVTARYRTMQYVPGPMPFGPAYPAVGLGGLGLWPQ